MLRFRAVSYHHRPAGWNWNAEIALNGNPLGGHTQGGDVRIIGRAPMFQARGRGWQLFSGAMIRTMFAPDIATGEAMLEDGQGASFALNVSDVARGVDGNMLRISNIRRHPSEDPKRDLIVRNIEIGWLDKSLLPNPPNRVPTRTDIKGTVSLSGLRLAQGVGGGFSVKGASSVELMVETALAVDRDARSALTADDVGPVGVEVEIEREGRTGYCVTAAWPEISLVRQLRLGDGMLHWRERWTNRGDRIAGVPFQHRVFLREGPARFYLGGNEDNANLLSKPTNPTVFLRSREVPGNGAGITLGSDWLRLLARLRHAGGVGNIHALDLALPPGGSIDFELTVQLVKDGGGYWTFINDVRRRWGVNGGIADRPFFWNWAGKMEQMTAEAWEKAFGHLGPVAVGLWPTRGRPFMRLGPDLEVVTTGQYPRLPERAPQTPGKTPDLDVEAFATFEHREPFWEALSEQIELAHRTLPDVQFITMAHPAIECVYSPMVHRWPYAEDVIRTAKGDPFESPYYSSRFLFDASGAGVDWVKRDWKTLYFVPRPGSEYLEAVLSAICRSMDECGSDGMYVDEFSWAGHTRGYSRYDYSRWDGYSADLDARGNVVRLKSDNGFTTESAQIQIVSATRERGKFFLGNGSPAVRSVNDLHALCFCEGGNGVSEWAGGHLATVPLILGNFGDQGKTRKGVFQSVKAVLERGCIYSPKECNLVLNGPDNFVCKQYPISIRAIGPGLIKGDQRLITTHSGDFDWPDRDATVTLYAYDENGDLLRRANLPSLKVRATDRLTIAVPKAGLVIAEIQDDGTNSR